MPPPTDPAPSWDRRDRWTLRFLDPALERAFKDDHAEPARARLRWSCIGAGLLWVGVAILGPTFLDRDPADIYPIALGVAALLFASAAAVSFATTAARRDAIAASLQFVTGIAVLWLTVHTGYFVEYAMPGMMLVSVFAFGVQRHPFTHTVAIGLFHTLAFVAVGATQRMGDELVFQLFVVASAMASSAAGTYFLEDTERGAFAGRTRIADLHRQLDRLFHQYLSPDVARLLLEHPDRADLGGEVVDVSVLFADLGGYTAYAEGRPPDEVVAMLNDAYRAAVPEVFAEGGTIIQFMGDALMAIFNAPLRQPDHALRAVRAGLALQQAVAALPAVASRPSFRVGINTGPALVGNVGSDDIRNFSAIGDATNAAARLQTFAEVGRVVIGERTFELVRDRVTVRPLGNPELKGRSQPMRVYELVGMLDPVIRSG